MMTDRAALENPCFTCQSVAIWESKDNAHCMSCRKRIDYIDAIEAAPHSLPAYAGGNIGTYRHVATDDVATINGVDAMPETERTRTFNKTSSPPDHKRCRECGADKDIEAFAPQVKSADGRMHICRQCHGAKIIKAQTGKKHKPAQPSSNANQDVKDINVAVRGPRTNSASDRILLVDFNGYDDVFEDLIDLAAREIRKPAQQAIYMIKKAIDSQRNATHNRRRREAV